jgi:hypothetical protein
LHPNLKCILLAQSVSIFVVFIQIKLWSDHVAFEVKKAYFF